MKPIVCSDHVGLNWEKPILVMSKRVGLEFQVFICKGSWQIRGLEETLRTWLLEFLGSKDQKIT